MLVKDVEGAKQTFTHAHTRISKYPHKHTYIYTIQAHTHIDKHIHTHTHLQTNKHRGVHLRSRMMNGQTT